MLKPLLLMISLILSYPGLDAPMATSHPVQDVHVATWSTGTPDSEAYESLSFWIKDNQRAYIRYSHGKDAESIDLSWLGPDSVSRSHGFRISSPEPGHAPLVIVPKGDSLRVYDRRRYDRSFHWEDENENDSAASCAICAHSGQQAMGWLRRYFF